MERNRSSKQKMDRIRNRSLENVPAANSQLGLYHFQEVNLGQKNNDLFCAYKPGVWVEPHT